MPYKNEPAALLSCLLDQFQHLFKVHVIEGRPQRLCEITKCRVVRRFVQITPPNQKALRNQGHVALYMAPPPNEFLSAGVGKSSWLCTKQTADFCIRRI